MNLIFVADPMCSWCYGFGKELTQLTGAFPELPLQIVVGGVRAGDTEVMSEDMRQFRLSHWARVEKLSGLVFNRKAFLALKDFVYDTEPVCRAFVTARKLAPTMNQLNLFRRLQDAFYVDGKDTTDGEVLASVAAEALTQAGFPTSLQTFLDTWNQAATVAETRADFVKARQWGVSSFPQLLLETNGQLHSVAPGYTAFADLIGNLESVLHRVGYHAPVWSKGA
ncbi:MAG: hypothetical protein JWP42_3617 [Pseudomonas sp.]|nr:hypothetical protein [Pseudomonas sp.]